MLIDEAVRAAVADAIRGDNTVVLVRLAGEITGVQLQAIDYARDLCVEPTKAAPNALRMPQHPGSTVGGVMLVQPLSTIETGMRGRTLDTYHVTEHAQPLTEREHEILAQCVRGARAKPLTMTAADVEEARFRLELRALKGTLVSPESRVMQTWREQNAERLAEWQRLRSEDHGF